MLLNGGKSMRPWKSKDLKMKEAITCQVLPLEYLIDSQYASVTN